MESSETKHPASIAIHPFENLTGKNELDVFCKSLQIDLVTEFARYRHFIVVPHASEKADADTPDYGFHAVLQSNTGHLRLSTQLLRHPSGAVVWAERMDLHHDITSSQHEDLVSGLVETLQQQVNHDILIRGRKKSPEERSTYEHWLSGMDELRKGSVEADEKAREYFGKALELDSSYSLAYSGMSLTFFNEWSCQLWERWDSAQKGAYEWAKKAIEHDEQNYIACMVLGRIYVYEAEYEIGERYLRKALRLNPNDVECAMQVATCFIFLGLTEEARKIFDNAAKLTEIRQNYAQVGALIAIAEGNYAEAVAISQSTHYTWVDSPAMIAAAYYELGDLDNCNRKWETFMEGFRRKITLGRAASNAEAVQWLVNVNPFRGAVNMMRFWSHVSDQQVNLASRSFQKVAGPETGNVFVKSDDVWQVIFEGKSSYLKDAKGLHDLRRLLTRPGVPVHCSELMQSDVREEGIPVFDEKARREYRKKINELQSEIEVAENQQNSVRSEKLQKELDGLMQHLKTSVGLNGKARLAGGNAEKVRSAVTWRIRSAIDRVRKQHPALGAHLQLSVKTGTFCAYAPDRSIQWLTS